MAAKSDLNPATKLCIHVLKQAQSLFIISFLVFIGYCCLPACDTVSQLRRGIPELSRAQQSLIVAAIGCSVRSFSSW